jgi:WhiB family redox-sensing transcriptional regulator
MKYPDFTSANCASVGLDLFFEEEDTGKFRNVKEAKKICSACPIQDTCAEWGLKHEKYGIWGGLLPHERDAIRKQRNIMLIEPKAQAGLAYRMRME